MVPEDRHRLMACGLSLALFAHPLVRLPTTADVINTRRNRVLLTETTIIMAGFVIVKKQSLENLAAIEKSG